MGEIVLAAVAAIKKAKKEDYDKLIAAMTIALLLNQASPRLYESVYQSALLTLDV